jgi:hypothetical protein
VEDLTRIGALHLCAVIGAGRPVRAARNACAAGLRAIVCPAPAVLSSAQVRCAHNAMIAAYVPWATLLPSHGHRRRSCSFRMASDELDHAVVEAVPAVHHAGQSGGGVGEQVEVVAYELHLVERFVDGHGFGGVPLTPDDTTRPLIVW